MTAYCKNCPEPRVCKVERACINFGERLPRDPPRVTDYQDSVDDFVDSLVLFSGVVFLGALLGVVVYVL